jgi:hypothetical protein
VSVVDAVRKAVASHLTRKREEAITHV